MDECIFYIVGGRRNRAECLHDLLVVAKDGLKKTRIASEATLNWYQMGELLTFAKAEGLIKEVEVPPYKLNRSIRSPAVVWKTTEKGLKYAKNIYDNRARILEV
jgi:predicted transcriptional regulator